MRPSLLFLASLVGTVVCHAGTYLEVTCGMPTFGWITDLDNYQPHEITGTGGYGYFSSFGAASATRSCSSTVPGIGSISLTAEIHIDTSSASGRLHFVDNSPNWEHSWFIAYLEGSESFNVDAYTPGAVRHGRLYVTGNSCCGLDVTAAYYGIPSIPLDGTEHVVDITLGAPISLQVMQPLAQLNKYGNSFFQQTESSFDAQWRFTELDGTPVPLYFTPEPSTGLLCAGALFASALGKYVGAFERRKIARMKEV